MVTKSGFNWILCLVVVGSRDSGLNAQQPLQKSRGRLTIGTLRNTDDFDGAGCLLWGIKDRRYMPDTYVFMSDYEEHAAMNLNGRDVKLKLIDSQELKREFKVGDHSSFRYRGDGFDVEVVYTVTGVCKPDDEKCEVDDYNATITVTSGSAKQIMTAHGICGG